MLLDAAAFLVSSASLNGVAEAFSAHEIGQQVVSITQVVVPQGLDPVVAPDPGVAGVTALAAPVDPSQLPKLSGQALIQQLAILPAADVAKFVSANPSAISKTLADPPRAAATAAMWAALSPAGQKTLATKAPELVGNLDGVPFAVRNQANRTYLSQQLAETKAALAAGSGRGEMVDVRHRYEILQQIERALMTKKGEPQHQLLTFDPSGDGRAAVVVGDLATADYVSYLVPGMFFTLQGQMYDWTVIAQDLYTEQSSWLKLLSKTDPTLQGKTAATVAWIGYSTPGALDITSLDKANSGAKFLGQAVRGIQATRTGAEPYVTLVTHSYGSTAAMIELAKGGTTVDALAMIGSPGSAVQSASQLSVKNDNVFVGEAAWDPVVNTAFYGSDPGSPAFGAHTMSVAGGVDAVTKKTMAAAVGHLGYFDAGSESMRNLALIGLGQNGLVTDGTRQDASRTLASR